MTEYNMNKCSTLSALSNMSNTLNLYKPIKPTIQGNSRDDPFDLGWCPQDYKNYYEEFLNSDSDEEYDSNKNYDSEYEYPEEEILI